MNKNVGSMNKLQLDAYAKKKFGVELHRGSSLINLRNEVMALEGVTQKSEIDEATYEEYLTNAQGELRQKGATGPHHPHLHDLSAALVCHACDLTVPSPREVFEKRAKIRIGKGGNTSTGHRAIG